MQMNIWKIIYLNCGERYQFMIDHHSYTHNLSSCEIKERCEIIDPFQIFFQALISQLLKLCV